MDHVATTLLKRGLEAHSNYRAATANNDHKIELPAWGIAILTLTMITYLFWATIIDYTYGSIVATLAMIESPTAILMEPIASEDTNMSGSDKKGEIEVEGLLVRETPITSSLRKTRLHLRQQSGFLSQFRGFGIYLIDNYLYIQAKVLLNSLLPASWISRVFSGILAAVALAGIHMLWTHTVISTPSGKSLLARFASRRQWLQAARPAALLVLAHELAAGVVMLLTFGVSLQLTSQKPSMWLATFEVLAILVLGFVLVVCLIIPASVVRTRVEASLLAADDDTVVPFDRSFGGRIMPSAVGVSTPIAIRDAWKSFAWEARSRLAKVYLKVFVMQIALFVFMMFALSFELKLIFGRDMEKIVSQMTRELSK